MRLFRTFALVSFIFASGISELFAQEGVPQACAGRDLLAELKKVDPAGYAEVEKQSAATLNSGALLWKIEPPNKAKPSYLLGTMHVTDDRVANPDKRLRDLIAASRVVVFELANVGDRQGMTGAAMQDPARTMMPEGQSLWDVIPDDKEAELRSNPAFAQIPPDILARLQPWMLLSLFSSPPCERARQDYKFVLDGALYQTAQISNVTIEGLETISEQLDVFSSFSLADQAEMLLDEAAGAAAAEDNLETMVQLYLKQDVTAMQHLRLYLASRKGVKHNPRDEEMLRKLLGKRNVNMAQRSKPILDKGAAFIAVGALHLYGEDGVVALLRKAGYKVTAQKK